MAEPVELRPDLVPLEEDSMVTFKVTRGTFVIPAVLLEAGREHELARHFASNLPIACTTITRTMRRGGDAVVTWRKVRVVPVLD